MSKAKKRINSGALTTDSSGVLRLGEGSFSGLAYNVNEEGLVQSIDVVEAGQITGTSEDWFDLPEGGARVDDARLDEEEDYGPYLWRDAPMAGVVYTFGAAGVCEAEEIYSNGLPSNEAGRTWYASGAPRQLFNYQEGHAWLENGQLASKRVGSVTVFNLVFRGADLSAIVLFDAALLNHETLTHMTFCDAFLLVGSAIDTALFSALCQDTALADVQQLDLIETNVDAGVLQVLLGLPGLKTLRLENNPALNASDAEQIKEALPNCTVHFKEVEGVSE